MSFSLAFDTEARDALDACHVEIQGLKDDAENDNGDSKADEIPTSQKSVESIERELGDLMEKEGLLQEADDVGQTLVAASVEAAATASTIPATFSELEPPQDERKPPQDGAFNAFPETAPGTVPETVPDPVAPTLTTPVPPTPPAGPSLHVPSFSSAQADVGVKTEPESPELPSSFQVDSNRDPKYVKSMAECFQFEHDCFDIIYREEGEEKSWTFWSHFSQILSLQHSQESRPLEQQ